MVATELIIDSTHGLPMVVEMYMLLIEDDLRRLRTGCWGSEVEGMPWESRLRICWSLLWWMAASLF